MLEVPTSNLAKEDSTLAKPNTAEYAGEVTKEFLDVLEAVADQIPLPGVSVAVKIAKNIMQACDVRVAISSTK